MKKNAAFPTFLGGIVAGCLAIAVLSAQAQTPPAANAPTAQPATTAPETMPVPLSNAVSPKPPKATGKPVPPNRKYDSSYKHCKMRALRRGLKGTERRAFIRRCELGFAPPRVQVAPVAVPVPTQPGVVPVTPVPAPTPGAAPARK